jgi:hypothetical protein
MQSKITSFLIFATKARVDRRGRRAARSARDSLSARGDVLSNKVPAADRLRRALNGAGWPHAQP